MTASINYLAVLVAAIANMALGALWYSPIAFGKQWMALAGVTEAQVKARMIQALAVDFVGSLIMAFVLAHVVRYYGAATLVSGAVAGFWMWLAFIAMTTLSQIIYENRPMQLFVINNGFRLISLAIMGAILAAWR
jgi:uncharacterized membrane protein YagU involved in acid resistance